MSYSNNEPELLVYEGAENLHPLQIKALIAQIEGSTLEIDKALDSQINNNDN